MLKICYIRIPQEENSSLKNVKGKAKLHGALGKCLLKKGLLQFFGLQEEDYSMVKNEHGKPYIEGVANCHFNISHSGDYVLCAFSDQEVGVDIERIRKMPERVALRYFHPNEIAALEKADDKQDLFFTYWSLKETYLKYLGDGLNRGLSSFEVRIHDKGIRIYEDGVDAGVFVTECCIDPAYKCFVCSGKEEELQLSCWQYEECH
ncbi:4'-phosphopantetheinyl transferase superfamily protein [Porphyromonadaceae bacterium OttesenSCG-928-L07]|nr:4'-phosphopantetheinyl transferase superfamily protein [Porphyromonadaceae bacterium OttesenSCG-928-L07]